MCIYIYMYGVAGGLSLDVVVYLISWVANSPARKLHLPKGIQRG